MKIKVVPTIVAVAASALIAFGLYTWCKTDGQQILLAIGSFLTLFISLATCIGISFEGRTTANTATVGGLFFAILFISNLIFTFVQFHPQVYVILNGLLLLILILIIYTIAKTKQK